MAELSSNPQQQIALNQQAISTALANYAIIPLYQNTYFHLISPKVKNYQIESSHFDRVLSK